MRSEAILVSRSGDIIERLEIFPWVIDVEADGLEGCSHEPENDWC